MVERRRGRVTSLSVRADRPLIGVILQDDDEEIVRYFVEEQAADISIPQSVTQDALGVIGAWSDLDWDQMEEALDRIRHDSPPTPPIEL